MNILRDNKGAYFHSLSRGERVYLMMEHSYKMQRSPFRRREASVENRSIHDLLAIQLNAGERKEIISAFGEIVP